MAMTGHPVLPKMVPMTQGPVAYQQVPTLNFGRENRDIYIYNIISIQVCKVMVLNTVA